MISPFLMVKDFKAKGFFRDDTFMTNADVPSLALNSLVVNPVNPYTGKKIDDSEKFAHSQIVYGGPYYNIKPHSNKVLIPSIWFSVKDNIYDYNNWRYTKRKHFLDTNELPKDDTNKFGNKD